MVYRIGNQAVRSLRYPLVTRTGVASQRIEFAANYSIVDSAKQVFQKANKKVGEVAADSIGKAEGAADKAKVEGDKVGEKARVADNASGYKNLQDKGAKAESEQNRPDDAV